MKNLRIENEICPPSSSSRKKPTPIIWHPLVVLSVWAATLFGADKILDLQPSTPIRLLAVLLPALGFIYLVLSQVRCFEKQDELQQRIQLSGLVTAFVAAALTGLLFWHVRRAGFFPASEHPDLDYFGDIFGPSLILGYLFGWWRAWRRYQ